MASNNFILNDLLILFRPHTTESYATIIYPISVLAELTLEECTTLTYCDSSSYNCCNLCWNLPTSDDLFLNTVQQIQTQILKILFCAAILPQVLVRRCRVPTFWNFRVLYSTAFALDIWTSRKLWILRRNWSRTRTTVRRKMKVRKICSQVCTDLRLRWKLIVPLHRVCTCSVCNQLCAFLRRSLCITLSRHCAGLLRGNFSQIFPMLQYQQYLHITNRLHYLLLSGMVQCWYS